jgi:hypothetical protein
VKIGDVLVVIDPDSPRFRELGVFAELASDGSLLIDFNGCCGELEAFGPFQVDLEWLEEEIPCASSPATPEDAPSSVPPAAWRSCFR